MNDRSTDPPESPEADESIRRAIASLQSEPVPPGPPDELISMTLNSLAYPFRSTVVKDICDHLTPDESRQVRAYSRKVGILFGIVLSAVLYPFAWYLSQHTRLHTSLAEGRVWAMLLLLAILLAVVAPLAWMASGTFRKRLRQMLCETAYAKQLRLVPESLPLYDFTIIRRIPVLAIAAVAVPVAIALSLGALIRPIGLGGDPLAREILERMSKTYAECQSYRDSGVVTTQTVRDDGQTFTAEKRFETAFVRPDRFRFEYTEETGGKPSRYVIWCKGNDVRTWWDLKPGIETSPSRERAWGAATGISGGSSTNIPPLLWSDRPQGARLAHVTDARCADDGSLEGVDCFRVQGHFGSSLIAIWIEKQSYLVRRIDEQFMGKDSRMHQTTTYAPVLNGKIAGELLEFDPPAAVLQ